MLYLVRYTGPFAFIKPWTAVRDEICYSQQFLTPSMVAGIERKLFPELLQKPWGIYKIRGHRLAYRGVSEQQEVVQARGWNVSQKRIERDRSILKRGVLLYPTLWLAFESEDDAVVAATQHICLARNEDLLFPEDIVAASKEDFMTDPRYSGFELVFERNELAFPVGYNRFNNNEMMYGWLRIVGTPVP